MLNRRALDHELLRRRITRAELAAAAGISPQMLSDLGGLQRARRVNASMATASAIAAALECPVETLFPEAAGFIAPTFEAA